MDGVNQLPALLAQAKEGARNSVHIHRDYDRDGHAYRRGPWKVRIFFFLFFCAGDCWSSLPAFLLHTCVQRDKIQVGESDFMTREKYLLSLKLSFKSASQVDC